MVQSVSSKPERVPRDPVSTRATILAAAERAFSEKGFGGTSMRDVATYAGVHQSLIHHHFGSKQDLWLAMMRRSNERYLARQLPHLDDPGELDAETLPRALRIDFDYWRENAALLRLQTWAALEGTELAGDERDALYRPFVEAAQALQKSGHVRSDIDPLSLICVGAAAVSFWLQYADDLCRVMGVERDVADRRFIDDTMKLLFDGGANGPEARR
jgi:TetR/AcrR family transcriptional regulator